MSGKGWEWSDMRGSDHTQDCWLLMRAFGECCYCGANVERTKGMVQPVVDLSEEPARCRLSSFLPAERQHDGNDVVLLDAPLRLDLSEHR